MKVAAGDPKRRYGRHSLYIGVLDNGLGVWKEASEIEF